MVQPVSIRFLRSTGGLRGPRPLSALLDKRGRKSFGWRKRWHLKVLLLTYDSSRVTPFWRCPLFPRKVSYKVLKVPKNVSSLLPGGIISRIPDPRLPCIAPPLASTKKLTKKPIWVGIVFLGLLIVTLFENHFQRCLISFSILPIS